MSVPRRSFALSAVLAICLLGGAAPAVAQGPSMVCTGEGEEHCTEETTQPWWVSAPEISNTGNIADLPPLAAVLRRGLPILCGKPADTRRNTPEIDCRIEATIRIPAKAAKYLGLRSTVIAKGVAGDRVDRYKDVDGDDMGRAYFLELSSAVKSRLQARKVRALGVTFAGQITVPGVEAIRCASDRSEDVDEPIKRQSCSFDSGKRASTWQAPEGEIVCWTVMPWWVAVKSPGWGKMCPKPIRA